MPYDEYDIRLNTLRISTLAMRRKYFDLCSLHAIYNLNTPLRNKLIIKESHYGNRRQLLFHPPIKRTDFGRFVQPSTRFQYLFNNDGYNNELITLPKKKFKSELRKILFK